MNKTQKATHAELVELWRVLVACTTEKVSKGRPSAELLQEARKLLVQSGYSGPAHTPKVARQLESLSAAYLAALKAAVGTERPSSSILQEARVFLLQTKAEREQTPTSPTAIPSIPFKAPH